MDDVYMLMQIHPSEPMDKLIFNSQMVNTKQD